MRALVLYPMNALVEDQMVRLRRVLDGAEQLDWLDAAAARPSLLLRPLHRADAASRPAARCCAALARRADEGGTPRA